MTETDWFTEVCKEQGSALQLKVKTKLHEEQSLYQKIEIFDCEFWGHVMVIDGFIMLTQKDNYLYHEMMSHPVLYSHPKPQDVVIIGGGDCGVLKEVLQHNTVQRLTQVDIDERVTRLAEQFFPELCERNHDPRLTLLFDDGIQWVKHAASDSLDIMIVDSTDPIGPAEGLFGVSFYQECRRVLRPEGILVHQSESPLTHFDTLLVPMHQAMKTAGFAQTRILFFPQPTYPSGWWSATMASSRPDPLTDFRSAEVNERNFATHYYNTDIHRAALAVPEGLKRTLFGPSLRA